MVITLTINNATMMVCIFNHVHSREDVLYQSEMFLNVDFKRQVIDSLY